MELLELETKGSVFDSDNWQQNRKKSLAANFFLRRSGWSRMDRPSIISFIHAPCLAPEHKGSFLPADVVVISEYGDM